MPEQAESQPSESEVAVLDDEARALDLEATDLDTEHLQKDEQAKRSRGINLPWLQRRKAERAEKKEAEKSELFKEVNSLIEGHGKVKDFLRKRRLEQDYGKGRIGKLNADLACAGLDNGPTLGQEAVARAKKIGYKTLIAGGLSAVGGIALGSVSWPVLLTAVAAGTVGRAGVELYRLLKGDERRQKKELAKVEEATAENITNQIVDLNEMQIRKQAEDLEIDIMSDPEYKKRYLEIVEILYNSSKARVQKVGEGDDEQYIGLNKDESYTEGAKQINYGDLRKEVRGGEKKAESVANWVAFASSLLGGLAAGAHEVSSRAAEAGKNATDGARNTLENGGTIVRDFNGDDIPHKITLLRDAQEHLTDRLIYLKDAAHQTGQYLANGIPNPDMYTQGDVLSKLGELGPHWHDVGMGYQELLSMLDKAASTGAYSHAWIESTRSILIAGAAFFGQTMAEPTVNLFSESDESKKKKLEQKMAKYKYVLGGDGGSGGGDGGSDGGSGGEAGASGVPLQIIVTRRGPEDEDDDEEEDPAEAGPTNPNDNVEVEQTKENNDEERAARFWRRFDIVGEKADHYRETQKEYMEYKMISMAAKSGKLILDVGKSGRNNESNLDRLAAYRVLAEEMGYEIGKFEEAPGNKDEATIKKKDGMDIIPPTTKVKGGEPFLDLELRESTDKKDGNTTKQDDPPQIENTESELAQVPSARIVSVENGKMTLENARYQSLENGHIYELERDFFSKIISIEKIDDDNTKITFQLMEGVEVPGGEFYYTPLAGGLREFELSNSEWVEVLK